MLVGTRPEETIIFDELPFFNGDYLGGILRKNILVEDNSRQEVVVTYSLSARSIG